jgi:[ribosomal protein S18]-alanine N-acetyltransferase
MTGVRLNFRGYEEQDLEAMFVLDTACFAEPFRFSLRAMRQFAQAGNAATVVAEDDGQLVGFVIAHLEGETAYVVTIDVAEEYRRRGVGAKLLLRAERAFAGARRVALHVFVGNLAAARFYEGSGYLRVGEVKGFYGRGMDAVVFEKIVHKASQ